MKKINLWIAGLLLLTMALTACSPIIEEPVEPMPDETEDLYPVEEKPAEPAEDVSDAIGGVAYITDPSASAEELKNQAASINAFALDLYQKLAEEDGNIIYSPYSIFQAFLMVYAGANAETKAEIAEALSVELDDENVHNLMNALNLKLTTLPEHLTEDTQPLIFNVANALWAQKDFHIEQEFLDKLSANYAAGLKLVDFSKAEEARQLINLWVEAQTNEKIKDLIPQGMLNEMTRLVITNAVYFKGGWVHRFDAENTEKATFYLLDGNQKDIDMMHTGFNGSALVNSDLQVVQLPYEGGTYTMAAIMPTGDFKAFEASLDQDTLTGIFEALQAGFASIQLAMPKFKTESSFGLGDQLKALGIEQAFDAQLADFSGMTGEKDLYISDVIHKAYIDVNEEGTEAAAATAIGLSTTSMPSQSYEITLDHPFIYVIYERTTNTVVFMGRVVTP